MSVCAAIDGCSMSIVQMNVLHSSVKQRCAAYPRGMSLFLMMHSQGWTLNLTTGVKQALVE